MPPDGSSGITICSPQVGQTYAPSSFGRSRFFFRFFMTTRHDSTGRPSHHVAHNSSLAEPCTGDSEQILCTKICSSLPGRSSAHHLQPFLSLALPKCSIKHERLDLPPFS